MFWPTGSGDTEPVCVELDSPHAPGSQCFSEKHKPPHSHTVTAATDGSAPSVFEPALEYLTERVALFWQPLSYFSQWSPSSCFVDDVSSSCAAKYMMAEKARLFQDHGASERSMSSPGPREHKRIDRGVHDFDCFIWDRVREDAVLASTFVKFTQTGRDAAPIEHWYHNFG